MPDWTPLFKPDFRFSQPFNIFEFVRDAVIRRNESIDFFLAADRGMGEEEDPFEGDNPYMEFEE